ncbi:MAG: acyl carrier protein [Desulforhopalus sp.]|nr:acyl carrier protein [Desulforhopalus sp.]
MTAALTFDALLRRYLASEFALPVAELEATTGIFSEGYLDSFSMVELVVWLEKTFGVKFGVLDINLENLDTIERINTFVTSRQNG